MHRFKRKGCEYIQDFKYPEQKRDHLLAEASLEFFVHYQLIGSVPSFEIVDLIGNSGGSGAWDGDRDSGGVSGLYCFHSSMLPTTEGGHRRIEIPDDCFALIFEPPEGCKTLIIKETLHSDELQRLAKQALNQALTLIMPEDLVNDEEANILGRLQRTVDHQVWMPETKIAHAQLTQSLCTELGIKLSTPWSDSLNDWVDDAEQMLQSHGFIQQPLTTVLVNADYGMVVDNMEQYPGRKYGSILIDPAALDDVMRFLNHCWTKLGGNGIISKIALLYGRAAVPRNDEEDDDEDGVVLL